MNTSYSISKKANVRIFGNAVGEVYNVPEERCCHFRYFPDFVIPTSNELK